MPLALNLGATCTDVEDSVCDGTKGLICGDVCNLAESDTKTCTCGPAYKRSGSLCIPSKFRRRFQIFVYTRQPWLNHLHDIKYYLPIHISVTEIDCNNRNTHLNHNQYVQKKFLLSFQTRNFCLTLITHDHLLPISK